MIVEHSCDWECELKCSTTVWFILHDSQCYHVTAVFNTVCDDLYNLCPVQILEGVSNKILDSEGIMCLEQWELATKYKTWRVLCV